MRFSTVLIATSALALAACGDSTNTVDDPSDPEQIAAAASQLPTPQPGEYRTTGELMTFEAPGKPQEEVDMAREFMSSIFAQENTQCMTQEDADQGYRRFVDQMAEGDDSCEMTSYETTSESFTAAMSCGGEESNGGTMTFAGDVTETSMDMTMTMEGEDPSMGETRMVIRLQSERVGDCAADAEAAG